MEKIKNNQAFSTIELLIAMTILIFILSGVTLVSFGNQSFLANSQSDIQALTKAQEYIEKSISLARIDFRSVNPLNQTNDGYYTTWTKVTRPNPNEYFSKLITSLVVWKDINGINKNAQISTLVTDYENAIGGDTCDSFLTGDWKNPKDTQYEFGKDLLGDTINIYPISTIDAYKNKLYVAINNSSANAFPTLFQFDLTDKESPAFISSLDNDPTSRAGIAAVAATDKYVYVANARPANFSSCTAPTCGQLQIIDVSTPTPTLTKTYKIPGVTGTSGQAVGNSIFYKNGFVYLGLTKTGGGPEFNIIDVSDPTQPVYKGGYNVGYGLNDIYTRREYAYLAHPTDSFATNTEQITVLNITDPTNPQRVSGYRAPDLQGNGRNIFTVGDNLYLGRTFTSSPNSEFYILDNSEPDRLSNNNPNTPQPKGYKVDSSVGGLIIRDYLAFVAKGTSGIKPGQLQIINISDPNNLVQHTSTIPLLNSSFGISEQDLDCEGNYIYISSVPASGIFINKGSLSIVTGS